MKGPSLESIRKFKEQQERKKREDEEKKIQEKLSTLEHRANQGDRKAKQELKRIERIKNDHNKPLEHQIYNQKQLIASKQHTAQNFKQSATSKLNIKTVKHETDFDELMKLAKQNKNEIKAKPSPAPVELKKKKEAPKLKLKSSSLSISTGLKKPAMREISPIPQAKVSEIRAQQVVHKRDKAEHIKAQQMMAQKIRLHHARAQQMQKHTHSAYQSKNQYDYEMDEDNYDSEDDYDLDGFVVNEEDEDVQDKVSQEIRSIFRYDKRRCDLREREIDRQYRAIGRVETYEDLEREERRASRLAAAEDAKELRNEEARKKLKKLRLKKSR